MEPNALLATLHRAERLKDTTRHCATSQGCRESVAEHSWRLTFMAYWIRDKFPEVDFERVILMCLIHDLGKCFIGDIPTFRKTEADETQEEELLLSWVWTLPQPYVGEMEERYREMGALQTIEAWIYKALDNVKAVIQHNESSISSWKPQKYELNRTYGGTRRPFRPI